MHGIFQIVCLSYNTQKIDITIIFLKKNAYSNEYTEYWPPLIGFSNSSRVIKKKLLKIALTKNSI